eukprot:jgi/Botrbrau1/16070/Bobra.7_2s0041.1
MPVLVGHSAGGGMVQAYLNQQDVKAVAGTALLCPFPPTWGCRVVLNWLRVRTIPFLLGSFLSQPWRPIATPQLFKEVFLNPSQANEEVQEIWEQATKLESIKIGPELGVHIADPPKVLTKTPFVKVIGGGKDVLMRRNLIEETGAAYKTSPVILEDMAHDLMLDPSWTAAADALLKAIQDGLSGSAPQ